VRRDRGSAACAEWSSGALSVFFFSSRRRHTRSKRDWSSDVCSSDLIQQLYNLAHRNDGMFQRYFELLILFDQSLHRYKSYLDLFGSKLYRQQPLFFLFVGPRTYIIIIFIRLE